ncbi:bone marrow stromal antigen 2-like [Eptesicus fuscus]|uniref:bone marrow stromal antigen 2-like n=1 Tax=Eptesicus fuscus TaxID=29078 RepID=UPI00240412F7|nr:bone marrow stromal antigen 2-like [Eptesicus fuscus]
MAPTSCRYFPLPTDEFSKKLGDRKLPGRVWIVGILLGLLVVGLPVAVIILAVKANSPACKDGLRAEQECRKITHLLEQELTQAQDVLRGTEAQAAICNQTVETLKISLEEEKAGGHKQQELVQKLQEEIKTLNQELQEKSSELQKKSAELQKKSAELQKKSGDLVKKSGELQEKSTELEKKSAELQKKSAELEKKSWELEKKSTELQEKSEELQEKSWELEQLRQENEALVSAKCPPNSGISLHLSMAPVLLTLSLQALLA